MIPVVTKEMKAKVRERMRRHPPKKSPYKGPLECPECGGAMAYREDLVLLWARAGERVVIPRLSGHRCAQCGLEAYDAASTRIIHDHIEAEGPRGGYELRVTALSKGKLGLYFKEDVVREMRLRKGQGFLAIPLSRDAMLLERVRADA